jgi:hypothetical protein
MGLTPRLDELALSGLGQARAALEHFQRVDSAASQRAGMRVKGFRRRAKSAYTDLTVTEDLDRFFDAIAAFWPDVPEKHLRAQIGDLPKWLEKAHRKGSACLTLPFSGALNASHHFDIWKFINQKIGQKLKQALCVSAKLTYGNPNGRLRGVF